MESPGLSKPQTARIGSFLRFIRRVAAHWRPIVLLLILARVVFLVARSDEFDPSELIDLAIILIFIASQIFWIPLDVLESLFVHSRRSAIGFTAFLGMGQHILPIHLVVYRIETKVG